MDFATHSSSLTSPWRIACSLSVIVAYCIPIVVFHQLFPLVSTMPMWDQWHLTPIWETYFNGGNAWPLMFKPYQGHLNIIPRFIFIGLGLVSHWNIRWELITSFLVATATLTFLVLALHRTDRRLLILAAPVSAQVFCPLQFENFLSGYPLGQNISQCAATAAFYFTTKGVLRNRDILFAAIASLVATFSWGAGLVTWPVCTVAIALAPKKARKSLYAFIAASIIVAMLVRSKALSPTHLDLRAIALFFLTLLGKPVFCSPFPTLTQSQLAGVLVLFLSSSLFSAAMWARLFDVIWRWGIFGLLGLGSAILISVGRFESGEVQALSSHYVTAVYPVIVATSVVAASLLLRQFDIGPAPGRAIAWGSALAALALALLLQPVCVDARILPTLRNWAAVINQTNAKLMVGAATDEEIHRVTHPDAALVRRGLMILHENHLAAFKKGVSTIILNFKPLPATAFRVTWQGIYALTEVATEQPIHVRAVARNDGNAVWPVSDKGATYPVHLGYCWIATPPALEIYDSERINLPQPVPPGASTSCEFTIKTPRVPGTYRLRVDLLQENVAWFHDKGCKPIETTIQVVPQ